MIGPEELTDIALAASRADGCLVLLTDTSEATLRWANSTMTTNGHTTSRRFSVISVVEGASGVAAGWPLSSPGKTASRSSVTPTSKRVSARWPPGSSPMSSS